MSQKKSSAASGFVLPSKNYKIPANKKEKLESVDDTEVKTKARARTEEEKVQETLNIKLNTGGDDEYDDEDVDDNDDDDDDGSESILSDDDDEMDEEEEPTSEDLDFIVDDEDVEEGEDGEYGHDDDEEDIDEQMAKIIAQLRRSHREPPSYALANSAARGSDVEEKKQKGSKNSKEERIEKPPAAAKKSRSRP